MKQDIEAIFIDLGNTLRILVKDEEHMARARQKIASLVGTEEDPAAFVAKVNEHYKEYRKWAFENLREAPEAEMWTRWLAPDFPAERIAPLGPELTYQYRQSMGRRVVVNGGREVVIELQKRGYVLGVISNLIGTPARSLSGWRLKILLPTSIQWCSPRCWGFANRIPPSTWRPPGALMWNRPGVPTWGTI